MTYALITDVTQPKSTVFIFTTETPRHGDKRF